MKRRLSDLNSYWYESTALKPPRRTFGLIEGIVLSALTSAGVTGAALSIGTTLLAGIAGIGLSAGLSFLAQSLFRPTAPKPEDVQQSFRQPTPTRVKHYGRVKATGPWVFGGAKAGYFYKVIALGQGPIDAIEEFWVDDHLMPLDADGHPVPPSEWRRGKTGSPLFQIKSRLGQIPETHYPEIAAPFPEWTSSHRGDGQASLAAIQNPTPSQDFLRLFPNGINTNYRVVMRAAKVRDIVTNVKAWTDNAAAIIRDYIVDEDGMRLPLSAVSTPMAEAGWAAAFDRAAEAVPVAAGGTQPRYRLWGSYQLSERPADVLGRMLQCCDGRLVPTPDGGLTLDIGQWSEPTVIIGPETITGFSGLKRGRDVLTTANTIRATYLEPTQDYQGADADPWADEEDVSERGEIASDLQFTMAPSHSQARRLMKLAAYRANPSWVGTFQCNLGALAAIDQRFVRIQYPLFGINSVFEVQDCRFVIGEGGILTGVTLQVQSMPSAAYEWDASQEGTAPVTGDVEVDDALPVPDAPTVDFVGTDAELSFSPSPSILLSYQARYKPTASSEWFTITGLPQDATGLVIENLAAGEYEFQLRFITEKGRPGEWSASTTVDTTPPAALTGVSATPSAGQIQLQWTAPSSPNYAAANIRRSVAGDESYASLVRSEPGAPSAADSWTDTPSAGFYRYWLRAVNGSGGESSAVATGQVTAGTQRLTSPANLTNAAWTKATATVTASATTAAGLSMSRIEASGNWATVVQSLAAQSGGHVFECVVKKGTGGSTANRFAVYNTVTAANLISIVLDYDSGAITGTGAANCTATSIGDGVWRLRMTVTSGFSAGDTLNYYPMFVGSSSTSGDHAFIAWAASFDA